MHKQAKYLRVCIDKMSESGYYVVTNFRRNKMKNITLSPSIMCADLVNLEAGVRELEELGMDTLHIDIIDGDFSPSMPLGIETVKRLREITDMNFDIHIMSTNNEYFIKEMLEIGVQSVTFHLETSLHVDRFINLIKNSDAKVGIALNPATPIETLDIVLEEIDMVCLMLINPGFATNKGEKQVPYALKKINKLKSYIEERNVDVDIQVDGRVSLETIPDLVEAGASNLVLGSTSLFRSDDTLENNKEKILKGINRG